MQEIDDLLPIEAILSQTAAQCSGDSIPECAMLDILQRDDEFRPPDLRNGDFTGILDQTARLVLPADSRLQATIAGPAEQI